MKKVKKIISNLFIVILIIICIIMYKKYDYNFYLKGVTEAHKTVFSRDKEITTNGKKSYKIENINFNDAMFFREISVTPNTPYKISCMVKTENVEQYKNVSVAGAQIVLKNTEEHSKVIAGTTDWTKLEFCFNSKNNDKIEIGFRLGGNGYKAKGTAWFSDIRIQAGFLTEDTTWKYAVFIFKNLDVSMGNSNIKCTLDDIDIYNLKDCMRRMQESVPYMSNNKMQVEYKAIEIDEPITSLSYDDDNGYLVSEKDVYNLIQSYLEEEEYDHIFACFKMPNGDSLTGGKTANWVGLGNMEYCGKGFSNIRVPDNENKNIYKYASYNQFPEEVFIHEFLHTLERNAMEYGYERPELHSYLENGYKEDKKIGLKKWYTDYMNKDILNGDTYIGLPEEVYKYKPVQLSNFIYSNELSLLKEPSNIIEVINCTIERIKMLFKDRNVDIQLRGVTS